MVIRPATPADLPALVAAADAVFRTPPRPGLRSMGQNFPLLFGPDNAGNLILAVDDGGGIAAHTGFTLRQALLGGQPARVACFGAVFSAPEQRGRGLATRVFQAAIDRARASGAEVGLVSGARGMYARAGFTPYPLCRRYRVPAGAATAGVSVQPFAPEALDNLARLHGGEPTRFQRSPAEWRALASAGVVFHFPGRLFVLGAASGPPLAYLAVALPAAPPIDRPPRVLELAGDRSAVAGAAPELARILGAPGVELILPPHDDSLEALAAERGWAADRFAPVSCMFQRWNPALLQHPLPFYGLDYI